MQTLSTNYHYLPHNYLSELCLAYKNRIYIKETKQY